MDDPKKVVPSLPLSGVQMGIILQKVDHLEKQVEKLLALFEEGGKPVADLNLSMQALETNNLHLQARMQSLEGQVNNQAKDVQYIKRIAWAVGVAWAFATPVVIAFINRWLEGVL